MKKHNVWPDTACTDREREARLERRGVFCGIIQRKVRRQMELRAQQQKHSRIRFISSISMAPEHPFPWINDTTVKFYVQL
jgi:hypothetical protein